MTTSIRSTDEYEQTLRELLVEVNQQLLIRQRYSGLTAEEGAALREASRPRDLERVNRIVTLADAHLIAAEAFERENLPTDSDPGPEDAALMGGYWIGATSLIAALQLDPDEEPFSDDDALAARATLSLDSGGTTIVNVVGADAAELPRAAVVYALDHDLPSVVSVLSGLPDQRGGAEQDPPTVDDAIQHVVDGLVKASDTIVTSTVARSIGGVIGAHVWELVSPTGFGEALRSALDHLSRLRKKLFEFLGKAVALARKYLGRAVGVDAAKELDDWLHAKVLALFTNVQASVARRLLRTPELSLECAQVLAVHPDQETDLRKKLPGVTRSYDDWAKWGRRGSRALAIVPLSLLGPYTIPVLAVAVLALLSYEFWVAADHLDRPTWVPLNVAPGIATVIGVT